jgi:hypothetical protein
MSHSYLKQANLKQANLKQANIQTHLETNLTLVSWLQDTRRLTGLDIVITYILFELFEELQEIPMVMFRKRGITSFDAELH